MLISDKFVQACQNTQPRAVQQKSATQILNDKHHTLESQNNPSSSVFEVHVWGRLTTEHVPLLIHSINCQHTPWKSRTCGQIHFVRCIRWSPIPGVQSPIQISKICWISKLRIASNFQAKRSDSKDSEKRWLKGMPGYSLRAIFGCLHLSSYSKSLLSWVLGYWVQGLNLSSSRLSHGTRILKQSWNLATTTKNVGKKSQSLESTGLQPTWPEAASPTHSSTSPKFLPWPCAVCRKSHFPRPPFWNEGVTRVRIFQAGRPGKKTAAAKMHKGF